MKPLHTVLGASGATGHAVIQELKQRKLPFRTVARSQKEYGGESIAADLMVREHAYSAIEGSSHVYLCVGLPYQAEVWEKGFPLLMDNVISACEKTGARLIYFDNVYMYGPAPLSIPFDEAHSQQPTSRKGKARKATTDLLRKAMKKGRVEALIARSADFYGPKAINSPFYISFLERILEGKRPQSIAVKGVRHTYAYTLDSGRAMVDLALEEDCYGQVWHLPVGPAVTVEEMMTLFNREFETDYKVAFLPTFVRKILGLFIPPLKEAEEMHYQYATPYEMSWEKFRARFPEFEVTSYANGVKEMVADFRGEEKVKANVEMRA